VFDRISSEKLPDMVPVLELGSPVEHVSVHSERAVQSHLTSRVVLDNPTMDDVTMTLSDDVEHNRPSPRELRRVPRVPTSLYHINPLMSTMRCRKCLMTRSRIRHMMLLSMLMVLLGHALCH